MGEKISQSTACRQADAVFLRSSSSTCLKEATMRGGDKDDTRRHRLSSTGSEKTLQSASLFENGIRPQE